MCVKNCGFLESRILSLFPNSFNKRVNKLCVYFMTGTPEGSTESDFLEKPGIEPATSEVSHMRKFKSFAARLCDKDYKFMSWVT